MSKVIELIEVHPLMEAFVITAVEKYAEMVIATDPTDWPENHIVTLPLWQSLASKAKEITQ